MLGVRNVADPDVQALVAESGVTTGGLLEAARFGEVAVLAVPHAALAELLPRIAPLVEGKVVVDCTNAIAAVRASSSPARPPPPKRRRSSSPTLTS